MNAEEKINPPMFAGEEPPKTWMCWAKLSNREKHCRFNIGEQNIRCKRHGANLTIAGPSNPAYKHGLQSTWLKGSMREPLEIAMNDPELLSSREAAAAWQLRQREILQQIESSKDQGGGTAEDIWSTIKELRIDTRKAASQAQRLIDEVKDERDYATIEESAGNAKQAAKHRRRAEKLEKQATAASQRQSALMEKLLTVLDMGVSTEELWREYQFACDAAQAAKETEMKRMAMLHVMMPVDKLAEIFRFMGRTMAEVMKKPDEKDRIRGVVDLMRKVYDSPGIVRRKEPPRDVPSEVVIEQPAANVIVTETDSSIKT